MNRFINILILSILVITNVNAQGSKSFNKTFKKLQGKWVAEEDSLDVINVRNKVWEYGYLGYSHGSEDTYNIQINKKLPQFANKKVKSEFLTLVNQKDTIFFEILGLNDSILSLLCFPSGRITIFNKIK